LDPKNPNTLGRPTGLNAVSMRDTVELRWDQLPLHDLSGFRIYRRLEGEAQFSPIGNTATGIFSFRDVGVTFDTTHVYQITALAKNFESPPSEAVMITPGPTFTWVVDQQAGDIVKLTHDGLHEILRSGVFISPFRLEIDQQRGWVWVLDDFSGELGRLAMNGRLSSRYRDIDGPVDLSLDPNDGSIWVADNLTKGLLKFDSSGALIKTLDTYKKISALAVNPKTSELWALDQASLRVLILSSSGELRRVASANLQRPSDIDIEAQTGKAWVADGDRLLQLDAEGNEISILTHDFCFVSKLAVDQNSGACWLIDASSSQCQKVRVIKVAPNGDILHVLKDGFGFPLGLAVNPYDGSCLIADAGFYSGRLIRISSDGRLVGSYDRFTTPYDVDIALSQ
jgi:DNA-binding beta-propeller fold protein YncE